MKNYLKVNHKERLIVMDRTFEKNAQYAGSNEYNLLQQARKDYANYTVVRREIKKNAKQEHYEGLTYEYMFDYISKYEPEETRDAVLAKFGIMIDISKCHSKKYATVKKWFLDQYPIVKEYGMEKKQTAENADSVTESKVA